VRDEGRSEAEDRVAIVIIIIIIMRAVEAKVSADRSNNPFLHLDAGDNFYPFSLPLTSLT